MADIKKFTLIEGDGDRVGKSADLLYQTLMAAIYDCAGTLTMSQALGIIELVKADFLAEQMD